MKEKIDPNMHVIDIVLRAMQESGVPPRVEPIRGGTDGAQLSFKGLPVLTSSPAVSTSTALTSL